jgi:predicted nucleotide-binding protein (sugar kinase/HSP70/actin superfamily)
MLTVASLLDYTQKHKNDDELLLYLMPTVSGNCRFSQYYVFLKRLVEKKRLKDVALFTFTSENGYVGIGPAKMVNFLKACITSDIMDDIRNALLVLAEDKEEARRVFDSEWGKLIKCFERGGKGFYRVLEGVSRELSGIKLRHRLKQAKKVLLAGEIFVRKDEFSSQDVIKRLAEADIIVKRSPVLEWVYYVDHIVKEHLKTEFTLFGKAEFFLRQAIQRRVERKIKSILSRSGLYEYETVEIEKIMKLGSAFVNPALTGESILVIGSFFKEILKAVHGVISVGPFTCLPTRVTESILSHESRVADNPRLDFMKDINRLRMFDTLPFFSLECDGNPFPQIVESRIEAFSLQVEKLYETVNSKAQKLEVGTG